MNRKKEKKRGNNRRQTRITEKNRRREEQEIDKQKLDYKKEDIRNGNGGKQAPTKASTDN